MGLGIWECLGRRGKADPNTVVVLLDIIIHSLEAGLDGVAARAVRRRVDLAQSELHVLYHQA